MASSSPRILVLGCNGQIGSELVPALRERYGKENVLGCDLTKTNDSSSGPFYYVDAANFKDVERIIVEHHITWLVHLVALVSIKGEAHADQCMDVNMNSVRNVLKLSEKYDLRCFIPSTIAVFGSDKKTPQGEVEKIDMADDDAKTNPKTVYGITKVFTEQLCTYYREKGKADVRCLRYPGVISFESPPGGGTTDYAIDMCRYAVRGEPYQCPLHADEMLPMMYMPDCIRCTMEFLAADRQQLSRCVYNVHGCSFNPQQLYDTIQRLLCGPPSQLGGFEVSYLPNDPRQGFARGWPAAVNADAASADFGWAPEWTLDGMTAAMLRGMRQQD